MSKKVRLLPDQVVNQIAAGEVVQRPASAVKELLENAVDAGATKIDLILKDAGRTLIQVIDNGHGMDPEDAKMAFERHATSKIQVAEDLFDLTTNGFRGEALASIAAVAHVKLRTRRSQNDLGTEIRVDGGNFKSQVPIQVQPGTNIEVRDLFYNIPARRNFLKSNTVETRHIINAFQRVALTYPEVQFRMVHNDNELFNLSASRADSPSANLRQRIVAIMGRNSNEKLVPIAEETDILKVYGFVGKPGHAKKKRGEQFFFVNDRYVKSNYLNHAISSAFEGLIPPGHHPAYYLFLEVPRGSVDVNIHPTKTEVKFDNDRDLYAILRSTVKHSLGQYNVSPTLDFERDSELDTPYAYKDKKAVQTPTIAVDKEYNPFRKEYAASGARKRSNEMKQWEALYVNQEPEKELIQHIDVIAEDVSQELFEEDRLNSFPVFQLHSRYIASSIRSGIVLIEQSHAHQRILYEEYLEKLTLEGIGHQKLLFPLQVMMNKNETDTLRLIEEDLRNAGFHVSEFNNEGLKLDCIPSQISEDQVSSVLLDMADNISNEVPDQSFSQVDSMAKSLAKSLSIKVGVALGRKEQEDLVNRLFSCKEPNYSPFGKKTYITISMDDLEKKFNA